MVTHWAEVLRSFWVRGFGAPPRPPSAWMDHIANHFRPLAPSLAQLQPRQVLPCTSIPTSGPLHRMLPLLGKSLLSWS